MWVDNDNLLDTRDNGDENNENRNATSWIHTYFFDLPGYYGAVVVVVIYDT